SLFLYYQSGIITSGIYTFFPGIHLNPTILNFLSFYIIIHNLIILAGTIAGAIPFYIVSFGLIYYNSGVLISIIVGSLLNGTANLILPYAILELLSIALASGTGITLFSLIYYYFFGTFTSQNEFKKYYSVNIPKVIVGIGISLVLFLFAWDIEYYVLLDASGNMIYPPNWYYLLYVLDFVFSGASIIILFRVYKYGIINPLPFLYYFFPSFLLLFNITAGHSFYWSNLLQVSITAFLVFFSSFTVIFSALGLNEIFTTSSGNKIDSQFFILRARGKSMYPTIKDGDLVIVENTTAPSRLKIGEILFLRVPMKYAPPVRSGRYVGHRLIGINGQYLVTKGDNEPKQDRKIPIWYWEGIVVAKIMAKVDDTILLENLSSDKSIFDIVQSKRDQILNVLRKMDEGTDRYFSLKSVKTRAIVSIVIAILFTVFVFLV
ncbi:MAG: S24/S26 family peptidase, partial [Thermoplasmata archaeon]